MQQKLLEILAKIQNKKILVIGDIMLDKYIWGKVKRISPEAPVQIVNVDRESYVPGGAANVASNITSISANAFMVSIVGNDTAKNILIEELKKRNVNTDGIFIDDSKPTVQKVRVIGHNQQLLRIDYEKDHRINTDVEQKVIAYIEKMMPKIDAIIISDYSKGLVTENVAKHAIEEANKQRKIAVIDPKPKHKKYYANSTIITPNNTEASELTGISGEEDEEISEMGKTIMAEINSNVLITRGERGMTLFEKNGNITNIPTKAKEVYDVTGAGDTVVAVLTAALCTGANYFESASLANYAAGIVVGKVGTSSVTIDEIKKSIEND